MILAIDNPESLLDFFPIQGLGLEAEGPIRVRRLITQFSYPELVRTGVIPDFIPYTSPVASKRYPPWIYALKKTYSNIFADFGLFVENVIAVAIRNGPMNYSQIWTECSQIPVPIELQGANNFIGGIIGWARSTFNGYSIQHNVELVHQNVAGHPDFISQTENGTWILDCKMTAGFKNMAEESFLQILSYCTLARVCGHTCNFIGILLPLQRQILWYNLTGWNEKQYLNLLLREAGWVEKDMDIYNPLSFLAVENEEPIILSENIVGLPGRYLDSDILGSHAPKEYALSSKFRNIKTPIQIFLSNPQGRGSVPQSDLLTIVQNTTNQTKLFVHAPYIINLCSEETWGLERLCHELLAGQQIGAKGVIVHVGKYKELSVEQGLNKMEASIRKALEVATAECPLVIETPAGEGTELCTGLTQLQTFYDRFNGVPNLKICMDSAHVWGAGYDPEYYLKSWLTNRPGAVVLIHFNDSGVCRGSRVDKHHHPGLGHIGYKRLWKVHEICKEHDIPMVRE